MKYQPSVLLLLAAITAVSGKEPAKAPLRKEIKKERGQVMAKSQKSPSVTWITPEYVVSEETGEITMDNTDDAVPSAQISPEPTYILPTFMPTRANTPEPTYSKHSINLCSCNVLSNGDV